MQLKFILSSLLLAAMTFTISAQTTPGVTIRQGHQHTRIVEGRASGELSRSESRELRRQQRRIRKHKQAVKADGVVTKRERAGLRMHENKASRDIRRKKHN